MSNPKYCNIKVNIFFVRVISNSLKILFIKNKGSNFWELPNTVLTENEDLSVACKRAASLLIGQSHTEDIEYKLIDNIICKGLLETNYLSLNKKFSYNFLYNKNLKDLTWFYDKELTENNIVNNIKFKKISNFVREFVRSDYANVRYFIKNKFTLSELQKTFINLGINKKQFHEKRNFRKWLFVQNKDNLFIEETNLMQHGNHRPAKLYKPLDRIV
ncbi:MAG: hypothetical protein CMN37_08050 [SAR116 cluster bacterium]|nr:hypothetical protein [SAR116 cluster bacterium]